MPEDDARTGATNLATAVNASTSSCSHKCHYLLVQAQSGSWGLVGVRCRNVVAVAAFALERTAFLYSLVIETRPRALQYALPMGDRNLQEWISDQLYTLLGKHARACKTHVHLSTI